VQVHVARSGQIKQLTIQGHDLTLLLFVAALVFLPQATVAFSTVAVHTTLKLLLTVMLTPLSWRRMEKPFTNLWTSVKQVVQDSAQWTRSLLTKPLVLVVGPMMICCGPPLLVLPTQVVLCTMQLLAQLASPPLNLFALLPTQLLPKSEQDAVQTLSVVAARLHQH
jgi:hypothetical protein